MLANANKSNELGLESGAKSGPQEDKPNQIQLKWKVPEFVKSTNGDDEPSLVTSKIQFKGLLWHVEMTGNKEKIENVDADPNTLMLCHLMAENNTDQTFDFVGRLTVTTAYHNKDSDDFSFKQPRKSTFTAYSSARFIEREQWSMLTWYESEFPNESCSDDDFMKITIIYLGDRMSRQEAKLFETQHTLLGQMKEEVKGIDLLIKWANAEFESGDNDGLTLKDDFIVESKNGTKVGFNKALLKVRGGDSNRAFFKVCLSSEMKESRTSHVKLENFDTETILGFKEYLYHGTLPNLKTNAVDYFKFGDYCELAKIKQLAELEFCKHIFSKQIDLQYMELARQYETTYLKEHILNTLKEDAGSMGKLISKNFDVIDFSEL